MKTCKSSLTFGLCFDFQVFFIYLCKSGTHYLQQSFLYRRQQQLRTKGITSWFFFSVFSVFVTILQHTLTHLLYTLVTFWRPPIRIISFYVEHGQYKLLQYKHWPVTLGQNINTPNEKINKCYYNSTKVLSHLLHWVQLTCVMGSLKSHIAWSVIIETL